MAILLADHLPTRPQRMDLLDRLGERGRDSREARPLGLREPQRGKAPPLLLAGVSASVRLRGERVSGPFLTEGP